MSGEGERASRPNSLLLEPAAPEREPLHFDVQLIGAPPEVEQLVNNIKQVAEDFLYHWKTFPIVLPPSRFSGPGNRLSDIILPPPCDELDEAALDAGIEPQPLSPKQLHSIRDKGEFEVPSRHFPGQTHVWRVAGWLQRGRARAREDLYRHVARAVALVVVVARDRLLRDKPLSLRAGFAALLAGLHRLLDLLIGMPSMEARDLEKKIREERSRYLVAELICKPEHEEDISALAAWVVRAMRRAAAEKPDARDAPRTAPRVPALYTTPQRTQVDLRLYRRDLLRRAASTLQSILERESRGWFLHFRERHAQQLASQKMPLKDIEEEVREAAMREYVSRVCASVQSSAALAALGAGVPQLLAEQLRASAIVHRAEEGVRKRLEAGLASAEARLRAAHPILSRASAWRNERLQAAAARLRAELRWAALEDAAAAMHAHKLHQHRYFLLRDLAFLREREPLLAKELRAATSPTRSFTWSTRVWRPARWRVTRHCRGRAETIPTVISARAPPAAPRSDPAQPVFLLHTERARASSTRYPAWRFANLLHRIWCWGWNFMFVLGVLVPWCSALSLRTLCYVDPIVPDLELSQVNGTLFPKRSSETPTMWSRLLALWRFVSKERSRFETEPDSGLLGKGLARAAHRAWLYGAVGGLGSLALLLLFPLAVVAACAASALAAVSAPLWVPPLAVLAHAACALVYDADCPRPQRLNRYFPMAEVLLWRIGVLGVLQPLCALALALLLCPLAALLLLLGGVAWWCVRSAWEGVAWRCVIARAARVPAHDSAFCRRVAGPGLSAPRLLELSAAQAAAGVAARGEAEALGAWAQRAERALERPLRDYRHFVDACFGPFSVQIAKTGAYRALERECGELAASLREKVAARRRELATPLGAGARARCRLSAAALHRALAVAEPELRRAWADADADAPRSDDWWAARGLAAGDWRGLTANALIETFDAEILIPLDEGAASLALEGGAGARAWEARCERGAPPDLLRGAPEPAAAPAPRVPPPALDAAAFSPRAPRHPPLPAPPAVALVLHNRDSDNPVPLESELCAEILRGLEDAPDTDDKRESVERYRGGGSSGSGSDAGSDYDEHRPVTRSVESGSGTAASSGGVAVGGAAGGGACRWTLTGRGVRLRADLASPEDVTLDAERRGTSV